MFLWLMILYCQMISKKRGSNLQNITKTWEYHFYNILTSIWHHKISYFFLAHLNRFDCQINQIASLCLFTGCYFLFYDLSVYASRITMFLLSTYTNISLNKDSRTLSHSLQAFPTFVRLWILVVIIIFC